MADERSYKGEIDASEILAKIEKGEDVDYENVIIKGNLDISRIKLPVEYEKLVVSTEISIKNSRFDGFVDFRNDVSKKVVDFTDTIFDGKDSQEISADFRNATFSRDADFRSATFKGYANFRSATFKGYANFSGAKFDGEFLTFRKAIFENLKSQENACRKAKNVLAKAGNRGEEEYHFYREIEAIRLRKRIPF